MLLKIKFLQPVSCKTITYQTSQDLAQPSRYGQLRWEAQKSVLLVSRCLPNTELVPLGDMFNRTLMVKCIFHKIHACMTHEECCYPTVDECHLNIQRYTLVAKFCLQTTASADFANPKFWTASIITASTASSNPALLPDQQVEGELICCSKISVLKLNLDVVSSMSNSLCLSDVLKHATPKNAFLCVCRDTITIMTERLWFKKLRQINTAPGRGLHILTPAKHEEHHFMSRQSSPAISLTIWHS